MPKLGHMRHPCQAHLDTYLELPKRPPGTEGSGENWLPWQLVALLCTMHTPTLSDNQQLDSMTHNVLPLDIWSLQHFAIAIFCQSDILASQCNATHNTTVCHFWLYNTPGKYATVALSTNCYQTICHQTFCHHNIVLLRHFSPMFCHSEPALF